MERKELEKRLEELQKPVDMRDIGSTHTLEERERVLYSKENISEREEYLISELYKWRTDETKNFAKIEGIINEIKAIREAERADRISDFVKEVIEHEDNLDDEITKREDRQKEIRNNIRILREKITAQEEKVEKVLNSRARTREYMEGQDDITPEVYKVLKKDIARCTSAASRCRKNIKNYSTQIEALQVEDEKLEMERFPLYNELEDIKEFLNREELQAARQDAERKIKEEKDRKEVKENTEQEVDAEQAQGSDIDTMQETDTEKAQEVSVDQQKEANERMQTNKGNDGEKLDNPDIMAELREDVAKMLEQSGEEVKFSWQVEGKRPEEVVQANNGLKIIDEKTYGRYKNQVHEITCVDENGNEYTFKGNTRNEALEIAGLKPKEEKKDKQQMYDKSKQNETNSSTASSKVENQPKIEKVADVGLYIDENGLPYYYAIVLDKDGNEITINSEHRGYDAIMPMTEEIGENLKNKVIQKPEKYYDVGLENFLVELDQKLGRTREVGGKIEYIDKQAYITMQKEREMKYGRSELPFNVVYDFSNLYINPKSDDDMEKLDYIKYIAKSNERKNLATIVKEPNIFKKFARKIKNAIKNIKSKRLVAKNEETKPQERTTTKKNENTASEKWINEMYEHYLTEKDSRGFSLKAFEQDINSLEDVDLETKRKLLNKINKAEQPKTAAQEYREKLAKDTQKALENQEEHDEQEAKPVEQQEKEDDEITIE